MITTVYMTSSNILRYLLITLVFSSLIGCASANKSIASRQGFNREQHMIGFYKTEARAVGETFSGQASFYGPGFDGKKTASGETYDQDEMTCAHKTLPFQTKLRVTLLQTGKSAVVRVTDRGPYKDSRILDLSVEAAKEIGLDVVGVGEVEAEVVE